MSEWSADLVYPIREKRPIKGRVKAVRDPLTHLFGVIIGRRSLYHLETDTMEGKSSSFFWEVGDLSTMSLCPFFP